MAITLYFYPYYARIVWICFRLFAILDVKIFELCDKVVKFFWISYISVCVSELQNTNSRAIGKNIWSCGRLCVSLQPVLTI